MISARGVGDAPCECDQHAWRLTFGNGSARGVAAMVVWILLADMHAKASEGDAVLHALSYITDSLLHMGTSYEKHGDGSDRAAIVANIARQEQDAKVQGVSTIEWINIILKDRGMSLGDIQLSRNALRETFDALLQQYEQLPEVQAYDADIVAPVAKRPRGRPSLKSRSNAELMEEDGTGGSGIRIGSRKLQAIKMFLEHGSLEQLVRIEEHLHTVPYKYSGLTDTLLGGNMIYPGVFVLDDGMACAKIAVPVPLGVKSVPLELKPELTKAQANFVLDKILSTFETDTATITTDEAKVKARPKTEELAMVRDVARWWCPAGEKIASQELTGESLEDLMETIRCSMLMDSEISALVQRGPVVFHRAMLPVFAADGMTVDDAVVNQMAIASFAAAKSRFEVFSIGWQADKDAISNRCVALSSLSSLLIWKEIDHKRAQARIGADLVKQHLAKHWNFVFADRMDAMGARVCEEIAKAKGAVANPHVLVIIDFNVPHTRDYTKLKALCSQISTILRTSTSSAALMWAPDFAKQRSLESVDDEHHKIQKELRTHGLDASRSVRSILRPHPSSENRTTEFPWWSDARLITVDDPDLEANVWLKTQVARTRRFHTEFVLPATDDLLDVTDMIADKGLSSSNSRDCFFKACQKGPSFSTECFRSLFEPSKNWDAKSVTFVVDLSPHAGDRAVGMRGYVRSLGGGHQMGHISYIGVGVGPPASHSQTGAKFSERRVGQLLAKEWMEKTLALKDGDRVVEPVQMVPEPTAAEFDMIPHAKDAYTGLSTLELKVCMWSGTKVQIKPDWAAEFANAPHELATKFVEMQEEHDKVWADLLTPGEAPPAPIPDPPAAIVGAPPAAAANTWVSVERLQAEVQIKQRVKNHELGLDILVDANNKFYLVDQGGDRTIAKGTYIGGFGSGTLLPRNLELQAAIPFELITGDTSWVQLNRVAGDDESGAKFLDGTFFSVLRSLEAKGYFDVIVTKYGAARPISRGGLGGYEFPDEDVNTHIEYVFGPSDGKVLSKENIFRLGACQAQMHL